MRVISQHGNVDLPYEQIAVCHAMESVIALYNGNKYVLGEYSSKEKSYKAMEMLRIAYVGKFITNADIPDDFNKQLKELMISYLISLKKEEDSKACLKMWLNLMAIA